MSVSLARMAASSATNQHLAELVDQMTAGLKAGTLDIEALFHAHPEQADELRRLLPTLQMLADLSNSRPNIDASAETDVPLGVLGDFRLVREVGRGGMGVVYEAEQISLSRRVALKVLPFAATMDVRQLQRFQNEVRAAASLKHPHIVPVYAVGCERGVHYYSMQFIEGHSVEAVIGQLRSEASSEINRDRTVAWGIQAATALEHAHSVGIVHRDIKPANLLIDAHGQLWVTDFGLARTATHPGLTMTGDVVGTLRYMSPEQAAAKHGLVDHRTDVYALGATLYELLTLRPAVAGKDREEILRNLALEEPKKLRRLNRAIPTDLETIVLKALANDPAQRYSSAQHLADDLECSLRGEPIHARPVGWLGRWQRWRARNPLLARVSAALVLLIVLVIAGLAGGIWLIADERDATQRQYTLALEREQALRHMVYVADMKVAFDAWKSGDRQQLRDLLSRHVPRAGETDLRGFEWHHLRKLREDEVVPRLTFRGHKGRVFSAAFSPNGRLVASAGSDRTVRVWSAADGHENAVLQGHTDDVNTAAFSHDGQTVATASDDGTVRLWNAHSGQETRRLAAEKCPAVALAFAPDGSLVAAGFDDGFVRLWKLPSGEPLASFRASKARVGFVAFSPDSKTLGLAGDGIRLWDRGNGKISVIHKEPNNHLAFSHDGRLLASEAIGVLRIWRLPDQLIVTESAIPFGGAQSLEFSPDDRTLAVSGDRNDVCLWDVHAEKLRASLGKQSRRVWSVAFAPDGQSLASGGDDGIVRLWPLNERPGRQIIPTCSANHISFSPNATKAAIANPTLQGAELRIVDCASGQVLRAGTKFSNPCSGVAYSGDGMTIATGSQEGDERQPWGVYLWDSVNLHIRRRIDGVSKTPCYVALNQNANLLATCALTVNENLRFWNCATGECVKSCALPGKTLRGPILFLPDDKSVLTLCDPPGLVLWHVATGEARAAVPTSMPWIYGLALSPDGRWAAACNPSQIFLWDLEQPSRTRTIFTPGSTNNSLAFSPDGKTLACGQVHGGIKLWHVVTGKELFMLETNRGSVTYLKFSPDGKRLTAYAGSEIYQWLTSDAPQAREN